MQKMLFESHSVVNMKQKKGGTQSDASVFHIILNTVNLVFNG